MIGVATSIAAAVVGGGAYYYYGTGPGGKGGAPELVRLLGPEEAVGGLGLPLASAVIAVYDAGLTPPPGFDPDVEAFALMGRSQDPFDGTWLEMPAGPIPGGEAGADFYSAFLRAPGPGVWYFVAGVRYRGGSPSYGDLDGSTNGIDAGQLGRLVILDTGDAGNGNRWSVD